MKPILTVSLALALFYGCSKKPEPLSDNPPRSQTVVANCSPTNAPPIVMLPKEIPAGIGEFKLGERLPSNYVATKSSDGGYYYMDPRYSTNAFQFLAVYMDESGRIYSVDLSTTTIPLGDFYSDLEVTTNVLSQKYGYISNRYDHGGFETIYFGSSHRTVEVRCNSEKNGSINVSYQDTDLFRGFTSRLKDKRSLAIKKQINGL